MPEYLALYKCVSTTSHDRPLPSWSDIGIPWVRRCYLEAENLAAASQLAREYRNFFKDDLTTVTPATILESVGKHKDGKPVYKIVQRGILRSDPTSKVWSMEMADLHIQ